MPHRAASTTPLATLMVRGDVGAISRIERRDKKANKASMRLKKKLDHTKRNQACPRVVDVSVAPEISIGYASSCSPLAHGNIPEFRKKLARLKDDQKVRMFSVSDIVRNFEDVVALIVTPASEQTRIRFLCDAMPGKEGGKGYTHHGGSVLLFSADEPLRIGPHTGPHVVVQKLQIENDMFVFYAAATSDATFSPPRALGLDFNTYRRIQSEVARMIGVRIRH